MAAQAVAVPSVIHFVTGNHNKLREVRRQASWQAQWQRRIKCKQPF